MTWAKLMGMGIVFALLLGLVGAFSTRSAEAANQSGRDLIVITCPVDSENPGSGPQNASEASAGRSIEGGPALCLASTMSGGKTPLPPEGAGACLGTASELITIQSHRGFGWVC
jgi:hypothetical protein